MTFIILQPVVIIAILVLEYIQYLDPHIRLGVF